MKEFLFARILRACGRLMLFIGIIFAIGTGIVALLQQTNHVSFNLDSSIVIASPIIEANQQNPFIAFGAAALAIIIAIVLLAAIGKIYNRNMRGFIGKLAKRLHVSIFSTEIILTLIAWTLATITLILVFPVASIITIIAFIVNELFFIFAWGAYGQPEYKL